MLHVLFFALSGTSAISIPRGDQNVFAPLPKPADLPVSNPTYSFWTDSPGANPMATEGSTGALTGEADVCIIGSGITGVSAAYHLATAVQRGAIPVPHGQSELRAVVLEARDFCSGATGRNGGNLTPVEFKGFRKVQERFGTEQAIRYYELEKYSASEMVRIARTEGWTEIIDLVEGGHIDVMSSDAEIEGLRADFEAALAAGKKVAAEWLSKEEMNSTYGTPNAGVRGPGYNLWPLKWVTHLYKLANRTSPAFDLRIHTHTPVKSVSVLEGNNSRRWTLHTPRGPVKCSCVVHATNAYASHILPHMAGTAGIIPTRGQVIALRADTSLAELTTTSWVGNEGYWFPRPVIGTENPLVILGGGRTKAGPPFEMFVTDDGAVNTRVGEMLRAFLPPLFPGRFEEGREPEREWTGIMGYTALEIPFVGPVIHAEAKDKTSFKGQYISAGYTGHGMPRAFACAEVVVGMIAADISGEHWFPPLWLPLSFLTTVRDAETGL